jgi:hypothetical protein
MFKMSWKYFIGFFFFNLIDNYTMSCIVWHMSYSITSKRITTHKSQYITFQLLVKTLYIIIVWWGMSNENIRIQQAQSARMSCTSCTILQSIAIIIVVHTIMHTVLINYNNSVCPLEIDLSSSVQIYIYN